MFDLHRHDEYSTFDGFGKASELAALAKSYGYKSLCTTNHGNTNGLIQTYQACKVEGIKSILGVEGYCLPKWKPQTRGYHLILVAKNLKGYGNMNRIQSYGEKQKYYNSIWDLELLEKYHEGLICTTACVASYSSQAIIKGNVKQAERFISKLHDIFGDDMYVEIQPYKISDPGVQEMVNVELIKLSEKNGWKMILTSDSHRGRRDEMPTYIKMHEIAGHNIDHIVDTYEERYMPKPDEMRKRFYKMHRKDFGDEKTKRLAREMYRNLDEIEDKCEDDYLKDLPLTLPSFGGSEERSKKMLRKAVKDGLKRRGKLQPDYVDRCKQELEVIEFHNFADYFLMVSDYTNWAKAQGIVVGPGRGSVCNSLVAYALGITEVDSLFFGLDFRRFLRKDKTSFPDIDLDFETSRRHEVIEYLCTKYAGHAARISSYGLYRVDNLMNDLGKKCGLLTIDDEGHQKLNKSELQAMKALANRYIDEGHALHEEDLLSDPEAIVYNKMYDNIMLHFSKLYRKVRFIGTHAAGVAITGGDIMDYTALRMDKDGNIYTSYNLDDIEQVNVIKFDILGLNTMESIGELREETGVTVDYTEVSKDEKVLENFREGRTDGIFQFEKPTAKNILQEIDTDCFEDVVAASAMNRPGPLSLHQPELYGANKRDRREAEKSIYWDYTRDSFGTIIYQEQVQQISLNIAHMSWVDADAMVKIMKGNALTASSQRAHDETKNYLRDTFIKGTIESGYTEQEAHDLFEKMTTYTFNKGHATGYSLISVEEMFYKTYFPNEFWFCKLKYARNDSQLGTFKRLAVKDGSVLLLPHVNWSNAKTRLKKIDGDNAICLGMTDLKGVGEKAAQQIVDERRAHGPFRNFDDFYDRCKSRLVTSRVIDVLNEQGALEFSKRVYLDRVTKYNSALYARD